MKSQTLLKKFQRGELDSSYGDFKKKKNYLDLELVKRKELIKPYLHKIDYDNLILSCNKLYTKTDYYRNGKGDDRKFKFKVPGHYIHDIQSKYLNPNKDITYQEYTDKNSVKYDILDKVYDSLYKVSTQNHSMYSSIMTSEIANYLQQYVFGVLTEEEQEELEKSSNGEGEVSDELKQKIQDAMENSQQNLKEAQKNASEAIDKVEELGIGGNGAGEDSQDGGELDLDTIKILLDKLRGSDTSNIRQFFKVVLDNSKNYFSSKKKYHDESLFDADNLDELEGLEYLSPIFKNAHLFDVTAKEEEAIGKIDLYIDISGSMYGHNGGLDDITKAKIMALQLINLGYVNDVYFFDHLLHKPEQTFNGILKFHRNGGTNFNIVVDNIESTGNNSVILTDGTQSCSKYVENVFWIGISGASFTYIFNHGPSEQYLNSKQCIKYSDDGTFIYE